MDGKEVALKDLVIGNQYIYLERDCGCRMFVLLKIKDKNSDRYYHEVECQIIKDLGSDPKIDLAIENNPHENMTLACKEEYMHYFRGMFYEPIKIDEDNVSNDYDAEVVLYENYEVKVGNPIYGYIYNDKNGRIANGKGIHTSRVVEYNKEAGIARTRNTVYKIITDKMMALSAE